MTLGRATLDARRMTHRRAAPTDAPDIHQMSAPFVDTGELRNRSVAAITSAIDDFTLVLFDETIVGCAAVGRPVDAPKDLVLYNFCVHQDHQGQGVGRLLFDLVIADGEKSGARRLFTATRSASEWFRRVGFTPAENGTAPISWSAGLDPVRRSIVHALLLASN